MYIKEIKQNVLNIIDETRFTQEELDAAISEGYTKLIEHELPDDYDPNTMSYHITYEQQTESGLYEQKYNISLSQKKINSRIDELKNELSTSDYKIIKMMEYQLLAASPMTVDEDGNVVEIEVLETNYDILNLHKERQAIRDEINRLKELLTTKIQENHGR